MCKDLNLWLLFLRLQNAREAIRIASEEAPGVPGLLQALSGAERRAAGMLLDALDGSGDTAAYAVLGGVRTELARRWAREVLL